MEATLDQIVDRLRHAKRTGGGASLLIGAGCSVSAGIPSASGFVELIQKEFPADYAKCGSKDYPTVMAALDDGYRRNLVAEKVDQATINWTHLGIAQLVKQGYVDRVLTTNFDPLVVKACALVGEFPSVYDFAASQDFRPDYVTDKAVFHLHGQRSGFVLLHTQEELERHHRTLAPVFEDAGRRRMWIVVGYSGESDPAFRHLAAVRTFSYSL